MRRFSFFAGSFILTALFAVAAFGQAAPAGTGKIGWINTGAFSDDKAGITKFTSAYKTLGTEAKPKETELVNIQAKLKTIADDLQKMQNAGTNVPFDAKAASAKQDEGQRLQREFEFKKKEYDAFVEKRGNELIGPIQADIGKALQDFAKQKGYTAILDIDKLGAAGAILALDQSADITKEFVTFYNARPAGSATAATPR